MPRTTVTGKGQVTIPQEVRAALGLEVGDQLLIEPTEGGFSATVLRKPTPASLQGLLASSVPYAGEDAEREAVGAALARKHGLKRR